MLKILVAESDKVLELLEGIGKSSTGIVRTVRKVKVKKCSTVMEVVIVTW